MAEKTALAQAKAFGYLTEDEVEALHRLLNMIDRSPVVAINIGAGAGTSGLAILESRKDLTLITIDKQFEGSPFGSLESETELLESAGVEPGRYRQIHGDSADVGRYYDWDDEAPDFVFVDGDHSKRGCMADISAWRPLIRDNGILAFHDYDEGPDARWPGVYEAVTQSMQHFQTILHVDSIIAFRIRWGG